MAESDGSLMNKPFEGPGCTLGLPGPSGCLNDHFAAPIAN